MPRANLPDDVTRELEQSESGTIRNASGPGVAQYWTADGSTHVVMKMGFEFDGYRRYQDISTVNPDEPWQFATSPTLFCRVDDLSAFNPSEDEIISIKVSRRRPFRFVTKKNPS